MRTVANVFLTTRQMGEAEAIYRLNPSLLLKNSNIACQWVSLGQKKDRSSRWVKATEEQLLAGVKAVNLEGHEGLFVEQQDMWSKYLRRPDYLEEICFAQFAKMYRSYSSTNKEDESVIIRCLFITFLSLDIFIIFFWKFFIFVCGAIRPIHFGKLSKANFL